jgi:hypothetical protein
VAHAPARAPGPPLGDVGRVRAAGRG